MATNQLALVNSACRELGEPRVTSLTETKAARELDAVYDEARQEALRDYFFAFGRQRFELTRSDADAVTAKEWLYSYAKPSGWLRTVAVSPTGDFENNSTSDYTDENGAILSNATELYMLCVVDVTDTTKFDATFDVALPLLMASKTSMSISQSGTLGDRLNDMLADKRAQAQSISAADHGTKRRPVGRWRASRGGN